jgi:hypothetical protein
LQAVNKTRYETILLNVVSKEYENRVDPIEGKIVFLNELLKDLKKDCILLRSHEVEFSFLFACLRDDAAKFFYQLPTIPPRVDQFADHRGHMDAMMEFLDGYMNGEMTDAMRAHAQAFAQRLRESRVSSAEEGEAGDATMAS